MRKKKWTIALRSLFIMAAALFLSCMLDISVYAEDKNSGTMNEGQITWRFNESTGTLTFTGTGPMDDMSTITSNFRRPWNYKEVKHIVIGEGITYVGTYTFERASNVQSISLPKSLRSIGDYAFSSCEITSLTVPEGVEIIGKYAFSNMEKAKKLSLPSTLRQIGKWAFCHWKSIKTINIPDGVTEIDEGAFYGCSSLKKVHLPANLKILSDEIFKDNSALSDVNIPENCTTIGNSCFTWCPSLKVLTIPASVKKISLNGLRAANLQTVYFMGKAPSFGAQCFASDKVHAVILKKYASSYSKAKKQYPKVIWQVAGSEGKTVPLISGIKSVKYNSVKISWKKMEGVSGFEVLRSVKKNSGYKVVKKIKKGSAVSYTDTKLTAGKTYYYKVRSFSGAKKSALTGAYKVKPVPSKPKTAKAKKTGKTCQVKVSWTKVSGASGYEVYRAYKFMGPYVKVAATTSGKRTAVVTGMRRQHNYYKIRAFRTVKGKKVYGGYSYPKSVYFTSTGS